MELRHIRYFVAVAEELHFGRAARTLNISQPPLSQQIQDLERELGVALLSRTRRSVELTPAGSVFLERARRLLQDAAALKEASRRAERGEIGELAVGFVHSAGYSLVPRIVRRFRELYQGVELKLRELTPPEQVAALEEKRIDIGLIRRSEFGNELRTEVILQEPFVLALPRGHWWAGPPSGQMADLGQEPFIAFPRQRAPAFHQALMSVCLRAKFTPQIAQEVNTIHTALGLVGAGVGIALVPASAIEIGNREVVFVRLSEKEPNAELFLIWRPDRVKPALTRFAEIARSSAKAAASPRIRSNRRGAGLPRLSAARDHEKAR